MIPWLGKTVVYTSHSPTHPLLFNVLCVQGCHSRTITQCVCDVDESCCTGKWDRSCVGIVADKCGECPKGA